MSTRKWIVAAVVVSAGAASTAARAQEEDERRGPQNASIDAAAHDGLFLASALAPRVGSASAMVSGSGGYDTAHRTGIASASTEARLWGPIALRAGAEYAANRNGARPTVGLRAQVLRQEAHGVDGALSVFYRPEGFTEPEGEIEAFVSLGRRFGRIVALGNLVYGQDPEGRERDGEVRLAALCSLRRWTVGLDSRMRVAIGHQQPAAAMIEPKFDVLAGPVATVTIGPVALFGETGMSVLQVSNQTLVGVAAVGGLGTVF